jgi:type I restriction enzyme R subunit
MWLTGFDAPCLHTMYVDKPMQGHGLMQAIARVNRVLRTSRRPRRGLPGPRRPAQAGAATYTESGGQGETALDQEEAVALMLEKYEVCCDLFHGFDGTASGLRLAGRRRRAALAAARRAGARARPGERQGALLQAVTELSKAFALAVPHEEALRIRDDVGSSRRCARPSPRRRWATARRSGDIDHAIRQIVSRRAIASDQVIDIFAAAGLKNPDISILSDQFLAEVRGMKHRTSRSSCCGSCSTTR